MSGQKQSHCFKALVKGRVQGVGFRVFTHECARKHQVSGWVRNTPDGNVEVYAQATEVDLTNFLTDLYQGPIMSRVDNIDIEWSRTDNPPSDKFTITR